MFYTFLLAHLVADFMLQPYWLVVRKRYWYGLLGHGTIVLACMLLLLPFEPALIALIPAMLAITAVHIAADWWKVNHGHVVPGPPIVPFLLDQVIHVATIAVVLTIAAPEAQIWSIGSSALAETAIYAACAIVALLATPIAVMVWLDPWFEHVALAGRARLRMLAASGAVMALVLFGGAFALPAALIGSALVLQRPRSPHPLDAPLGMLMVLGVAALAGTLILYIQ